MVEDSKITLLNLLSENWDRNRAGLMPKFSVDWYDDEEKIPQVVVSHVITTQAPFHFMQDPSSDSRKRYGLYSIGVWVKGSQEKRWKMIEEVSRILKAKCSTPGGDLEFMEMSDWRDLDDPTTSPKLCRSEVHVGLLYYA